MYVSVGMCQDGNQQIVGRLQTMWRKTWDGRRGRMLQQPNMKRNDDDDNDNNDDDEH